MFIFAFDTNSLNTLAGYLDKSCYAFLTFNFLWGLYCVILLWRRILSLRFADEKAQTEFLHTIQAVLDAGDFEAAKKMCEDDPRALPQLALSVIENRDLSEAQLRKLVADMMQQNILADLEFRLSWVSVVIKSGPLLGLFGTVLGMMAAFGRIGTGVKIQPSQIASDISLALVCTAMGLITAIPFTYILSSLNIRMRILQDALASGMTRFLEHFKTVNR